ncbi:MAG: GDP-mannose 4,6-dehydratase [Planctomycetaceae bacterium]|jgi:GDP-4-dehydro-6-deoxy-D-mannose reductase|nr:GDP-mannose 4,6-dehydratase [Planctomycetaceae bacterium]
MKRYLITGVSGFVGQHFLKYLDTLEDQFDVVGIDRVVSCYTPANYSYRFMLINFPEEILDNNFINVFQPDYVLHLAGTSSVSECLKNPVKSMLNNTNSLLNVLFAINSSSNEIKNNCRILVVSSSEVYADSREPLAETSICINKADNPYAFSKLTNELIATMYCDKFNFDIITTRSFMHTGPNQNERFVIPSFVKQLRGAKRKNVIEAKLKTGNINILRDITDVRDIVRAYYLLLKNGRKGEIYNVCSSVSIPLKKIIDIASEIINIPVAIIIDPERVRTNDFQIVVGNNKKIYQETGWKPEITISQTLQDMINCNG